MGQMGDISPALSPINRYLLGYLGDIYPATYAYTYA